MDEKELQEIRREIEQLKGRNKELFQALERMIEIYQFEVRQREKEGDKLLRMIWFEHEFRNLMNSYINRQEKIYKEIEEAKRDGDVDAELTGEALYKQMRHVIAELFQTMKRVGILDEEEVEFGSVKKITK